MIVAVVCIAAIVALACSAPPARPDPALEAEVRYWTPP
jgi:hypothetical protein